MYVSITGVVIYLLLYQIFPQPKGTEPDPTPPPVAEQPAAE